MEGRLESINRSPGGVPKLPVAEAWVRAAGLEGDRQRDRRYHGGPERAVTFFSLELIRALQAEGHPIGIGTTGENLTVSGLPWPAIVPGRVLRVGDARLQVTRFAEPCANIAGSFRDGTFVRISQKLRPGWSRLCARVLEDGLVHVGDPVVVLEPEAA